MPTTKNRDKYEVEYREDREEYPLLQIIIILIGLIFGAVSTYMLFAG